MSAPMPKSVQSPSVVLVGPVVSGWPVGAHGPMAVGGKVGSVPGGVEAAISVGSVPVSRHVSVVVGSSVVTGVAITMIVVGVV